MFDDVTRRTLLGSIGSTVAVSTLLSSTGGAETGETDAVSTDTGVVDFQNNIFTSIEPPTTAVSYEQLASTRQQSTTNHVSVTQSTETVLTIGDPSSGSVKPDEPINIWAGRLDTGTNSGSVGIPDEDLTISIDRPDGQTEEFAEVTNQYGSANISYSVPSIRGEYEITVTSSDGATASDDFIVGPVLDGMTQSGRSRPVLQNDTTTFRFLLREGQSPLPGEDVTIVVSQDDSEITQTTVQTDSDGFATYTDSPQKNGERSIEATATVEGTDLTETISYPVSELGYEYDFFDLDETLAGRQTGQGGRIWTADGPLANSELQLTYSNNENNIEITETAITDEQGFFAVQFDAPTGVDELAVTVETTDGRTAALGSFEDAIDVNQPSADEPNEEVSVDVEFEDYRTPPGTTTSVEIVVTDADGAAIVSESVHTISRYDFGGDEAPLTSETVVTDSDGKATLEIEVPNDAPRNKRLNLTATVSQNGEQFTGDDGTSIQSLAIDSDFSLNKEHIELDLEVVDGVTNDPVENVSTFSDIQYISGRTGSITANQLTSGSDGTDSQTVQAPEDMSFMVAKNTVSKQDDEGGFYVTRGNDYPGDISDTLNGEAATPGSEVTFTYSAEAGSVQGLLYGEVSDIPVATTFNTAEKSPSIIIPEDISGDSMRVRVWGVGSDGNLYGGSTSVDVALDGASETPDESPNDSVDSDIPTELDSKTVNAIVTEAGVKNYKSLGGLDILDAYTTYLTNDSVVGGTKLESSLPILDAYRYYLNNQGEFN